MRREKKFLGVVLVILVGFTIPLISMNLQNMEVEGRKYIYTAVIKLKSPDNPDDPWYTGADGGYADAHAMLASRGSTASFTNQILVTALVGYQSQPTTWNALTNYIIASDMDQIQSMTLRITFSFSTTTTTKLYIVSGYPYTSYSQMYTGVANTFNAGTTYRWTIIFPRYNDTVLSVFPFGLYGDNLQHYRSFPWSVSCKYRDINDVPGETSSGLTLSVTNSIVNATHIRQYIAITFDSTWGNRIVEQCTAYTTDPTILNLVNQRANRAVSQLIIARVNLGAISVQGGDQVIIDVYAVAPTALSIS